MTNTGPTGDGAAVTPPIVLDLGKTSRKKIKRLKKGRGPLLEDVQAAVAQVQEQLGAENSGKQIVPVVVLYRKRPRKTPRCLPRLFN